MAKAEHSVNTLSQTERQGSTTLGVKVVVSTEHSRKLPRHANVIRACRQEYGTNAPASLVTLAAPSSTDS